MNKMIVWNFFTKSFVLKKSLEFKIKLILFVLLQIRTYKNNIYTDVDKDTKIDNACFVLLCSEGHIIY